MSWIDWKIQIAGSLCGTHHHQHTICFHHKRLHYYALNKLHAPGTQSIIHIPSRSFYLKWSTLYVEDMAVNGCVTQACDLAPRVVFMRGHSVPQVLPLSFPFLIVHSTTMLMKVEIPASVYQIMLAHALSTEKVCIPHTHTCLILLEY